MKEKNTENNDQNTAKTTGLSNKKKEKRIKNCAPLIIKSYGDCAAR